ncbi:molybdopterin-dependent oxidoreductase [Alicyclobacillus mali]|uniref:Molybdopterin-dependent oxidoreductase n=1 Tax=Alicyclobacillus mali (ex Roth et al. 2021) TaxID=1123961 RepID=A0ABS0F063_9BACL|nr:molybdopterin-dependent oxidoreductase [Alicyclobacillus mali (ex Roth et al. 2021)]MBF8376675.1 molybdopterin-dependent oxidoreductase [Alicyclobacillus mali (ex Roth et al. 2021)]
MKVKTACPIDCYDACAFIAEVGEDGEIRLSGNPEHPITRGTICNRGRQLAVRRNSRDRVLYPLKREGDRWTRISWKRAMREIAEEIQRTLDEVGHHGILHYYDWGSGGLLKSLNQRFFYALGGCSEAIGSLCWDAGIRAQAYDFGLANSHSPEDMAEHAEAIVVWGRNVANTNVHMIPFIRQAQARGAKLVVITTLPQDLARRADKAIYPRPGTDGLLALAALRICRDEGWLDRAFLQDRAIGWEDLAADLDRYDLDEVARWTDVPVEDIRFLAELYGKTKPVCTLLGIGMQRYAQGGQTIRAIDALAAATGHVGIPGGGVNYAQRQLGRFYDEEAIINRRGADVREMLRPTLAADLLAADPPVQVMFVTRSNPVAQVPDSGRLREAMAHIRCKVVIDTFMTATAECADYVLPCTNVLEEEDVVYTTMWHDCVSYARPVVPPRGEAKPEWEIFRDLAAALGRPEIMEGDVDSWIRRALRRWPADKVNELRERGFVRLGAPSVPWQDGRFLTPSGKFEFASAAAARDGHSAVARIDVGRFPKDANLPYTLLTVHPRKWQMSQRDTLPEAKGPYPIAELGSEIAADRGIQDGDWVHVRNSKASVIARARVTVEGHPRVVRMEIGWHGQGVTLNDFTSDGLADFGIQAAQYDCLCDVVRVAAPHENARASGSEALAHQV